MAGECDKMNAEKTLVRSCDLPRTGRVMQAAVLKALLVSLGRLWFSVSVGEMRIGIQRGTGRAVSGETGGRGSPHPGTQGESHLTAHVAHAHARTHNGSHWWRIISSNQYQFMSFKTKVPISSPTQVLFRVHFVGWSNVKTLKNEQSSTLNDLYQCLYSRQQEVRLRNVQKLEFAWCGKKDLTCKSEDKEVRWFTGKRFIVTCHRFQNNKTSTSVRLPSVHIVFVLNVGFARPRSLTRQEHFF